MARSAVLLLLYLLFSSATAEIKNLKISHDSRPLILFEKFGFTPTGSVSISVSGVFATSSLSPPDPSLLGFFLLPTSPSSKPPTTSNNNSSSPSPPPTPPLPLSASYPPPTSAPSSTSATSPLPHTPPTTTPSPSPSPTSTTSSSPTATQTPPSPCLSAPTCTTSAPTAPAITSPSASLVPTLYTFFALVYTAFLAFLCFFCLRNHLAAHRIHLLMAALLLAKALNLICAAEDQHYIRVTGTPHGWDDLFQFLRVSLLFTVIVLIGTGWSFLKSFL